MCDEYNGWKNRETWAAALYLGNDQGLHELVLDMAHASLADAVADAPEAAEPEYVTIRARRDLGELLRNWFEDLSADVIDGAGHVTRDARMMLLDIGSL